MVLAQIFLTVKDEQFLQLIAIVYELVISNYACYLLHNRLIGSMTCQHQCLHGSQHSIGSQRSGILEFVQRSHHYRYAHYYFSDS